jgi:ribulose-phosphate 3-epimerase
MSYSKSTEVIPAIMPDTWADLQTKASSIADAVSWAQIDVMDGMFVSSHSWPYSTTGLQEMRAMMEQGVKLPLIEKISYEVDLMVTTPENACRDFIALGAKRVIVHLESSPHFATFLQTARARFPDVEFGVALGIETSLQAVDMYINKVDVIQLMGIARIGYQGEPFDDRVIQRVLELRKKMPQGIISVDGGVNFDTAPGLILAGVDRLVAGSAIFKSDDVLLAIERIKGNKK